jgi:hypothetical protein
MVKGEGGLKQEWIKQEPQKKPNKKLNTTKASRPYSMSSENN